MQTWQLQDAKNKFSQVVDEAQTEGPQIITRRGVEVAVLISYDQFRQVSKKDQTLSEFFASSPLADVDLVFERDTSLVREPLEL